MVGLLKLIVYRGVEQNVLHVTREELKELRSRLKREGWVIAHTEPI